MQKDVVFLSDRLARKMFDQENPIGKVISYNKEIELTVKGTYADIPENATVRPDAVISLPTVWSRGWGNYSWRGGDSWIAFIRFRPGADKSVVNARLNDLIKKYRPAEDQKVVGYTAFVKPIRDVYREEPDVKHTVPKPSAYISVAVQAAAKSWECSYWKQLSLFSSPCY